MTSEIRANKQTNRVGLGTVEYTNTGIIVSGIVTCTELSGLTALNIAGVGTASTLDINGDIDVDGHTNLDNVSVAGVTTFTGNIDANGALDVNGTSTLNLIESIGTSGHGAKLGGLSVGYDSLYATIQPITGNFLHLNYSAGTHVKIGASTTKVDLDVNGDVYPKASGNRNLGLSTKTWNNVYATTFVGALTGTASGNPTLANGSNNRVITATGANALTGESNLTFDGSTLTVNGGSTDTPLLLDTTNNNGSHLRFRKDGSNKHFFGCGGGFGLGDIDDLSLRTVDNIIFGVGTSEKVRIDSSGQLGIGIVSPGAVLHAYHATTNTIAQFQSGDAGAGILLKDNTHYTRLESTNGTFKIDVDAGSQIGSEVISFQISTSEKVRIDSRGQMGLGVTPNANWPSNGDFRALQVGTGIAVFGRGSGDEDRGGIAANYYHTGSAQKYIGNGHAGRIYFEDGSIVFSNTGPTANSSGANAALTLINRLQITSTGRFKINHTQTTNKLDDAWLSIYDANSDSSAIDPAGISKNYAMISLHNYGTGVPGDSTGIGFGAGSSFAYTKGSIAFARSGSYGTGDLVFLTNNDQDATMVNDTDEKMRITRDDKVKITGVVETGPKTITGGNNLAIQNFAVKGIYSGSPSIGKSIELISGYDSAVKMAAIGYNLTDVNLGSTYGGDLTFHTQPLYSSPTTPLPERMRISSSGYITKSVVPSWNLRPSYNSNQTTSNTSSHHAIGWSADSSGNGSTTSKATFLQNCTLHGSGFTYNLHNGQNVAALRVPVAGRYYVNVTYRVENNPQQGNIYVYVAGSQIARQHVEMWGHRPYMHCQWASVLNLAKNDEIIISISCPNATVSGRNDNVNWFSGYLIG